MNNEINNKAIKIARRCRLFFLDLIFPIECLDCGQEGDWLCAGCFKKINFKSKQYCLHCKRENEFGEFCPPCGVIYDLDGVWIAALYEDKSICQAIKILKYRFVGELGAVLGKFLILFMNNLLNQAKMLKPGLKDGVDWRGFNQAKKLPLAILNFKDNLVIPVPLAKKRLRWRGFNQAEILAKVFIENYGLALDGSNLIRVKHKKPQAKLNEQDRQANIKNCFAWRGGNLNKRNIILIDDVVTTGATLNECAKVLKANGAGEIWGLVAAKG